MAYLRLPPSGPRSGETLRDQVSDKVIGIFGDYTNQLAGLTCRLVTLADFAMEYTDGFTRADIIPPEVAYDILAKLNLLPPRE